MTLSNNAAADIGIVIPTATVTAIGLWFDQLNTMVGPIFAFFIGLSVLILAIFRCFMAYNTTKIQREELRRLKKQNEEKPDGVQTSRK